MTTARVFSIAFALLALAGPQSVTAANAAPALAAFDSAFVSVNDYTLRLHPHEVKGDVMRDRTYDYSFMRPHFAKTLIESGDGKGSGGVWAGGDQVSGHQGGWLSGIHLKVSLHDGRAVSLLGYTIPDGLVQTIVDRMATTPGTLTQRNGGTLDGQPTDLVTLDIANPSSMSNDISKQQIYFSRTTHWPIRAISWVGDKPIQDQSFVDIKTNVGLTQADFPF